MSSIYDPQWQRDPRWVNHSLGSGVAGSTIGKFGCFITAAAMVLTHYLGRLITPLDVDAALLQLGLYYKGNLWSFQDMPKLYAHFGGQGTMTANNWPFPLVAADLSKLVMDDTQERIAVIDFDRHLENGISEHALRWFGGDVADDPWYGIRGSWKQYYGTDSVTRQPIALSKLIVSIQGFSVPGFVPFWKRPVVPQPVPDPRDDKIAALNSQVADLTAQLADRSDRLSKISVLAGGK